MVADSGQQGGDVYKAKKGTITQGIYKLYIRGELLI